MACLLIISHWLDDPDKISELVTARWDPKVLPPLPILSDALHDPIFGANWILLQDQGVFVPACHKFTTKTCRIWLYWVNKEKVDKFAKTELGFEANASINCIPYVRGNLCLNFISNFQKLCKYRQNRLTFVYTCCHRFQIMWLYTWEVTVVRFFTHRWVHGSIQIWN